MSRLFLICCCLVQLTYQLSTLNDPCFAESTGFVGYPLINETRRNNNYGMVESPHNCQAVCQVVTGCRWFNWEEDTGNCWLMEFKGGKKNMDNVTTGPVECQPSAPCLERNVLYIGHPLARVQRGEGWSNNHGWLGTEEGCQGLCARTLGCTWFNWGSDSLCWLKTGRGDLVRERLEFGSSTGPGVCHNISEVMELHEYESQGKGWNYADPGPGDWVTNYPKCGGKNQSPVNLVTPVERTEITFIMEGLNFSNYDLVTANNTELHNNGHTVELELLSVTTSTALLSGGPLTGSFQLLQLHFHWGENDTLGSEHAVDGEKFPMEMHLVHMTSDLDWGIESAINPVDVKDGLAVTGFLFQISEEDNPAMAPVIESLQAMKEQKSSTQIQNESFSVFSIIQEVSSGPYFSYSGSLTTPTCNEVVQWMVFKETIDISATQLAEFRTLSDSHGSALVNNFRPLQDLGSREVLLGVGVMGSPRGGGLQASNVAAA